jgi:hypothetical protein
MPPWGTRPTGIVQRTHPAEPVVTEPDPGGLVALNALCVNVPQSLGPVVPQPRPLLPGEQQTLTR